MDENKSEFEVEDKHKADYAMKIFTLRYRQNWINIEEMRTAPECLETALFKAVRHSFEFSHHRKKADLLF